MIKVRLTGLFLLLTLIVCVWLTWELGLFSFASLRADGKPQTSVEAIQKAFQEKAKALEVKEAELVRKERELSEKEKLLSDQLNRYEATVKEQQKKISELEQLRDSRLSAFRMVYEKMDPKRAAKIIEEMETPMASQILSTIRQDRAAEILSKMAPEKALAVTEQFLGHKNSIDRNLAASSKKAVNEAEGKPKSKGGEP
ncbi:MAG: hypothetical protein HY537_10595 [Deltaproteobacteria bacterium]|nr:hypothetical protein [Deltaproteobacteria bacterium]